jgi:hypothetical protein
MPGTGPAPTVSDRPPGPDEQARARAVRRYEPQPTLASVQSKVAASPTPGRVIAVFGPPGAGTSTIIQCLADVSELRTAVLRPDFGTLSDQIDDIRRTAAAAIFIDGFPNSAEGVQYLHDNRFVCAGEGAIVRVQVDPELVVQRKSASLEGITAWNNKLAEIEDRIRVLNMPYFMIHNDDLEQAVIDLTRRANVTQ